MGNYNTPPNPQDQPDFVPDWVACTHIAENYTQEENSKTD